MDRLARLLVVVEPAETAPAVLGRAIPLARHFDSTIDLLLCVRSEAEKEAGERFLKGLTAGVGGADVPISCLVREGPSVAEIVAARLQEVPAELIIKYPSDADSLGRRLWKTNDWQLLQVCDAHVLLTRGGPWHAEPRFAAAIDLPVEGPRSARAVLEAMILLAVTMNGRTAVLHVATGSNPESGACDALSRVAAEFHLPPGSWSVLQGDPATALAAEARKNQLDLIALGAHTRRRGWREFFGTLSGKLLAKVDCDLLLVNGAS